MTEHVVVVGAGIIGLACAVSLQERGYNVTLVAEYFGSQTTSSKAGGIWIPYHAEPKEKILRWSLCTHEVYAQQATIIPSLVSIAKGGWVSDLPLCDEMFWLKDSLPSSYKVTVSDIKERDSAFYTESRLPIINTPEYLEYLTKRFQQANGTTKQAKVNDLVTLKKELSADLLINCTGLGSKELLNDDSLYGLQGQVVKLAPMEMPFYLRPEGYFCDFHGAKIYTYVIPRSDGIIIGGYAEEVGVLPSQPSREVSKLLIEKASLIVPELKNQPIIAEYVGVRPCRDEVRLELEWIDGHAIIHNYGHGGCGWTVTWGCAQDVLDLTRVALLKPNAKL